MRPMTKPTVTRLPDGASRVSLSVALSRCRLERKYHGTDIKQGTQFYVPVLTLLARTLDTRREDLVFSVWPILGCPFFYYESLLPPTFYDVLMQRMAVMNKPALLWEIFDLLQSPPPGGNWEMRDLIVWVRAVEEHLMTKPEVMTSLQAGIDAVRERNDREGLRERPPAMTEGVVIPADGVWSKYPRKQ